MMMTNLSDLQKHLATITAENWESLFALLPEIEKTETFGEMRGGERLEDGSHSFPYWQPAEIVSKTWAVIHGLRIMPVFDWMHWQRGKEILDDRELDYTTLDILTLCQLLTFVTRADRFSEGYIISCFQQGVVEKIIKGLAAKVKNATNV